MKKAQSVLNRMYADLNQRKADPLMMGLDRAGQKFLVQVTREGAGAMHPAARPKTPGR